MYKIHHAVHTIHQLTSFNNIIYIISEKVAETYARESMYKSSVFLIFLLNAKNPNNSSINQLIFAPKLDWMNLSGRRQIQSPSSKLLRRDLVFSKAQINFNARLDVKFIAKYQIYSAKNLAAMRLQLAIRAFENFYVFT